MSLMTYLPRSDKQTVLMGMIYWISHILESHFILLLFLNNQQGFKKFFVQLLYVFCCNLWASINASAASPPGSPDEEDTWGVSEHEASNTAAFLSDLNLSVSFHSLPKTPLYSISPFFHIFRPTCFSKGI